MSESERQELNRLLASRHVQGRRTSEVLRFLCEKHWDGERVTQYDLALALYNDVENLAGARNLVKNLRQKLELYYATDGRDAPLQLDIPRGGYEIVFLDAPGAGARQDRVEGARPIVGPPHPDPLPVPAGQRLSAKSSDPVKASIPPGCPLETGEETVLRARWPSVALVTVLTVFSILVIVVVTLQGFSKGRRAVAQSLAFEGNEVIGQTKDEPELWRESMPAKVFKTLVLDAGSANRFVVFYGGLVSRESPPSEVTSGLAILSPRGEKLETIDLLEEFNPFRDKYDKRYFRFGLSLTLDFDKDGHQDLVVSCNHLYYPSIIYSISGRNRTITGAFANSGKIKGLEPIERTDGESSPGVVGVAINNMMGEQLVAFQVPLMARRVSPDLESSEFQIHHSYRPTGLIHLAPDPWTMEPGNILEVHGVNHSICFDPKNAMLDTDPWFGAGRETDQAANRLVNFYSLVIEARRSVDRGDIDRGQSLYDSALNKALDEPLRLYALLDAARSLKKAGMARESLDRLSWNPDELFHPRRVLLLRAVLLTLLGEYEAARETYLDAEFVRYSYKGFVQACILGGMSREDLYQEIAENYSHNTRLQATGAWLKIPALLRGEEVLVSPTADELSREPGLMDIAEDHIRYHQESIFWNAVAELEYGIMPQSWPDQLDGPMERSDVFPLKIDALVALRCRVQDGPESSLPRLEASYRALREAALSDSDAIIPFVLLAYACGFAADETGRSDLAREALGAAVSRYPFGSKYEQAMKILKRPSNDA